MTRALNEAVLSVFGKVPTAKQFPEIKLLNAANDDAASDDPRRTGPSPGSLLEVAVALSQKAPLLIVIDEFGKNLEAAQQRPDADLYLLQLLAEAAQSQRGSRIYLVTMQHLAFNEYASAVDSAQQREWAKIQGRFEDIALVDTPSQTRRLISTVFTADKTLRPKIERWAKHKAQRLLSFNCSISQTKTSSLIATPCTQSSPESSRSCVVATDKTNEPSSVSSLAQNPPPCQPPWPPGPLMLSCP